jgi:hypothetical protein
MGDRTLIEAYLQGKQAYGDGASCQPPRGGALGDAWVRGWQVAGLLARVDGLLARFGGAM